MITQEELKRQIEYNPDTGVMYWKTKHEHRNLPAGRIAGSYDVHGYLQLNISGNVHKCHRLAFLYMDGAFPRGQSDHINHIRTDNRWKNLRDVDNKENHRNRPMQSNNKSGFVGVYYYARTGRWLAFIFIDGKKIHLGTHRTLEEAIVSRKEANAKYGFHENHGIGGGKSKYKRY